MNKSNWVFDLAMADAEDVPTPNSVTMETKLLFKHAVSLSKGLLFGRRVSVPFVDGLQMMNASGTSCFLLSPLKCNKFLLCRTPHSPLKQRFHFSTGF